MSCATRGVSAKIASGRGRDTRCPAPPAQIPARAANAPAEFDNSSMSQMIQTANSALKRFNSAPWVSPDIRMTH